MKKITLLFFLVSLFSFSQQGRKVRLGAINSESYLLGSLPKSAAWVSHKLKVEIFGGNFHNSNLGENHYYISTRDGLKINQEVHGGSYSRYELKIYENGNWYDFVVQPTANYPAFYVRVWMVDNFNGELVENDITDYDPTGKIDVTSDFTVNTLFATTNDGNIGIGTLTPDSKLTVAGNIHSKEVKVTVNAGADFVFEEDYNLPKLEEVQKFIAENGHLPDIASANNMEENGIHLSEMNIKLLQKIEELTLYTIEQEKKLEKLENLVEQLINDKE